VACAAGRGLSACRADEKADEDEDEPEELVEGKTGTRTGLSQKGEKMRPLRSFRRASRAAASFLHEVSVRTKREDS
jgi:hypothetical protein